MAFSHQKEQESQLTEMVAAKDGKDRAKVQPHGARKENLAPAIDGRHIDEQVSVKSTKHIGKLVRRRFRPIQLWIFLLFLAEGILGWLVVGWPALTLCILGTMYMAKVAGRHQTQASVERICEEDK